MEEESSLLLAGHRMSTIFALAAGEMQGGAAGALLEITRKGNDDAGRGSTKKKETEALVGNFHQLHKTRVGGVPIEMLHGIGGVGS